MPRASSSASSGPTLMPVPKSKPLIGLSAITGGMRVPSRLRDRSGCDAEPAVANGAGAAALPCAPDTPPEAVSCAVAAPASGLVCDCVVLLPVVSSGAVDVVVSVAGADVVAGFEVGAGAVVVGSLVVEVAPPEPEVDVAVGVEEVVVRLAVVLVDVDVGDGEAVGFGVLALATTALDSETVSPHALASSVMHNRFIQRLDVCRRECPVFMPTASVPARWPGSRSSRRIATPQQRVVQQCATGLLRSPGAATAGRSPKTRPALLFPPDGWYYRLSTSSTTGARLRCLAARSLRARAPEQ